MVICLYIACKVEEHHYAAGLNEKKRKKKERKRKPQQHKPDKKKQKIDLLARNLDIGVKTEQILNGEKFVLQTLKFNLVILHPFRSIEAYFMTIDLKVCLFYFCLFYFISVYFLFILFYCISIILFYFDLIIYSFQTGSRIRK